MSDQNQRAYKDPTPPSTDKPIKSTSVTDDEPKPTTTAECISEDAVQTRDLATFRTHVQVFLVSTGDDSGSSCELEGWLRYIDGTISPPGLDFTRDYPVKSSWAGENGGLGRQLFESTASRVGLPLGFNVQVYEDDIGGLDHILTYSMDFASPENARYRDGSVWTLNSWNTEDNRYRVTLWWQVTS